jgi:hypothetical protein
MDESPKRGLLAAYGRLLGPLIRILIRNGVTFEEFAEVAKHSYVKVALEDFEAGSQADSDSRVASLTGLTAGESRSVTEQINASPDEDQSHLDQIVGILTVWHTDSDYTGPYGIPLELKYEDTNTISFSDLVEGCYPGASARTLLDELLQAKTVEETEKGWFKVLKRYYMPEPAAPDGLEHLSRTLQDLVNTMDHNRSEENPKKKRFERYVYTEDGIRPEDLPRFEAFASSRAQILLEEIDNWLTQLDKPDPATKHELSTGLGIFHYIHRDEEEL